MQIKGMIKGRIVEQI